MERVCVTYLLELNDNPSCWDSCSDIRGCRTLLVRHRPLGDARIRGRGHKASLPAPYHFVVCLAQTGMLLSSALRRVLTRFWTTNLEE